MSYARNKERSRIITVGVSKTDQAGADATDINIIMKKAAQTGMMPGSATQPIYADFSVIPTNLRDILEMSKGIEEHRARLPRELQGMTTAELLTTPPQRLAEIMTEHTRYEERHAKLPKHFQSMSRQDVLGLTEEQYTRIITPDKPTQVTNEPIRNTGQND